MPISRISDVPLYITVILHEPHQLLRQDSIFIEVMVGNNIAEDDGDKTINPSRQSIVVSRITAPYSIVNPASPLFPA